MADYKFLQHIDGAWRQLKRWVMYKYSGTPSDAQEGSFWYDTATKTPKYHNGTTAKDIGKYVVAGTGTTVAASGNDLAVNVTYGAVANTSCVGNDSRLSDARTPISHAVSATTYGVGTSSNYGHVKLYTSIGNNTDGAPTNSAVSGALALKANVSQLTDGSVTKVGTASVGSTTVPVYVNAGTLTACSGTLGVSITGNAATATTATKLGSTTVGSTTQPIYLNAGVPTAITGTISNSTTGNAATATKLGSATIGSASVPIYLNNGTPTVCTKVDLDANGLFSAGYTSRSIDTPVASVDGEYIVYRSNTPTGTVPATSSWWYVTEHRHNATYYEQTMTDYFSNRSYHRIMNNGTWGAWREVAYTDSFTSEYVSKVDTNTQSIASQLQTYKSIYNHASSGTRGTAGHFKVCTMTVTSAFVNRPIEMTIVQRRKVKSTRLSIAFAGLESLDPTLSSFVYFGDSVDAYLYKSATSTWELYVTKIENYDNLQVIEFNDPHNYMPNIVWDTTQVSTIPSGSTAAVAYTLNNNTTGNAATATKVGTSSVGSTTQPVYIDAGTPTACSGTLAVSITGNAATATKVGTSSVGSTTQPVYIDAGTPTACSGTLGVSITGNSATATTATKVGSATVGSASQPIYLNAGAATVCNGSVGSATQPTYVNAGVNTACSGTLAVSITGNAATATKVGTSSVGSTTQPVYVNAGTLTACSGTLGVSITGNSATATTATKLATARTIALTGDVTGSANFDGSDNVSVAVTSAHLASNTGVLTAWQTKGSKGNYTGISAPGALRVNFMSRTDSNYAGLHCETDGKWMVLRNNDGTLKTEYAPATTSNSNEIATTAFVNSRINQYEFDYTGAYSASNVDFAMKIASWVPSSSTTYSIMFEFDYAGISIYPWQNLPFSVIVTYRDGTFNVYYEMIGNHAGYSRIYCGMNSTTAEIWVLGYGSYIRFKGRMISQSHSMYNVSGTITSTIPAYLSNMGNVVRNATSADKLGTTTVGSIYKPVYFSNGVPVMTNADAPSNALNVTNSTIDWGGGTMCYYKSGSGSITVNLDNAPRGCVLTLLSTDSGCEITLNRTSSTFYVSGWSATPTSVTLGNKGSVQFIIAPDFPRVYVIKYIF